MSLELARVLINPDNPSIEVDDSLCKNCHICQRACQNEIGVFGFYDVNKTGGKAICINCGRCLQVCPFNAIKPVSNIDKVKKALNDIGDNRINPREERYIPQDKISEFKTNKLIIGINKSGIVIKKMSINLIKVMQIKLKTLALLGDGVVL